MGDVTRGAMKYPNIDVLPGGRRDMVGVGGREWGMGRCSMWEWDLRLAGLAR